MISEDDVLKIFLARRNSYNVSHIEHVKGRAYNITKEGKRYNAVVLPTSFAFYEKRYHLAKKMPDLVICFRHDTVLPVPCLSMEYSCLANPCDIPHRIKNLDQQRHRSKLGSRVVLGAYLCGTQEAQTVLANSHPTTRKRYVEKAKALGKRKRGRPVSIS